MTFEALATGSQPRVDLNHQAIGGLQVVTRMADGQSVESLTSPAGVADEASEEDAAPIGGVILRFAGGRYAVDMASVAEVVPVPVLTRIPGGPAWLSGVVNWRGRVLPVIDLRPLVGATLSPMPTSARLVVLAEADILQPYDLGLAHRDAARDLGKVFAKGDLMQQLLGLAEFAATPQRRRRALSGHSPGRQAPSQHRRPWMMS